MNLIDICFSVHVVQFILQEIFWPLLFFFKVHFTVLFTKECSGTHIKLIFLQYKPLRDVAQQRVEFSGSLIFLTIVSDLTKTQNQQNNHISSSMLDG